MSSPVRKLCSGRRTPLPCFRSAERWTAQNANPKIPSYQVKEYLAQYPQVLEEYILESVSEKVLEDLLSKKKQQPTCHVNNREPAIKLSTLYSEIGIGELSRRIMKCTEDMDIYQKIYEITRVIASTVDADAFTLYIMEGSEDNMAVYDPTKKPPIQHVGPVGRRMTVSAHVAAEKKGQNVINVPQDSRFPKGVGLGDDTAHYVMCIPILLECDTVYAVVECMRGWERDEFTNNDFQLTNAILSWVTACVQKMKLNKVLQAQTTLNNYLLGTTKVMFDHMENIDSLITNIMMFTKDLVNADRCTLFLVDEDRHELFADYFDEGNTSQDGIPLFTKKSQIRFPQERGIAGYVAKTGEIVNIPDAYKDDRFNRDVDMKTGYHTKSILCMPIISKNGILGVVQMINRLKGDHFTKDDENTFRMFAVYCALALHYSRIYNLLTHQQTKYKVAIEVLQFHITASEEDVKELEDNPYIAEDDIPATFDSFDYVCYDDSAKLPQLFIKMVIDCFGPKAFEINKLCNFVCTVRKNYRPVKYHNWQHGFHVAHSLWQMLSRYKKQFTRLEKMSLIFAGICHDLDHRGYSNEFFQKLKLPLAALYSTSVMENHHYKQAITILHTADHDIFSFLTATQHKDILETMRSHIMATDLALYFGNQKYLSNILQHDEFDMGDKAHRDALISLMMTGADLCAISKPWETQDRTVGYLYEEFYKQGDEERKRGIKPIPMMDRNNKDEIPKQQVGFISFICHPLYATLASLLPKINPLLEGSNINRELWEMVSTEKAHNAATLIQQ